MKEILEAIKEWQDNKGHIQKHAQNLEQYLWAKGFLNQEQNECIAHLAESLKLIANNDLNLTAHDMSFHANYTLDPESVA